jgi:FtsH-binding integral membrane protein
MNYANMNEYEQNYNPNLMQEKENEIKAEIDINLRLGFIRKVYGILSVQLLITSLFTLICMSSDSLKLFLLNHVSLFYIIVFFEIIISFVILCIRGISRNVPWNYIILLLFTLAESYIVGFICAFSNPKIVFMAATMTMIIVIFLTIYAATTKTEITIYGSLLFLISAALFCLIIFNLFFRIKLLYVIISSISVIIFGIYIVYDTQLILGTKKEMLQLDDYILGSFFIYTDIINLFLHILNLLNIISSD